MKLVATDIDGTILPHGGEISDRTVRAIREVHDAGIPVVLVTARPPRWLAPIAERLGHVGEAVVANGAALIDLETERVIDETTISAADTLEVVRILRAEIGGIKVAVESARGMSIEPEGQRHPLDFEPYETAPFEELAAVREGRAFKILARAEGNGGADAMIARVAPLLAGLVEPSHSAVDDALLEFSPAGVSKASGLERLAARRGAAAADVIAFGDAPNDVPMLEWAGRSYAMGDGHPAAKAAATSEAPAASDDGVALVLEDLFALARD